jgi:hypothetical protein
LSDIIEEILELLFLMILIELHVEHALSELFKHQCPAHSTVLVEYLFISLLLGDLFDLHNIGGEINCPNHPYGNTLGRVLNVSVELSKVDSILWHSIGHSVSVKELFKLVLTHNFKGALGIHKVQNNFLKLGV